MSIKPISFSTPASVSEPLDFSKEINEILSDYLPGSRFLDDYKREPAKFAVALIDKLIELRSPQLPYWLTEVCSNSELKAPVLHELLERWELDLIFTSDFGDPDKGWDLEARQTEIVLDTIAMLPDGENFIVRIIMTTSLPHYPLARLQARTTAPAGNPSESELDEIRGLIKAAYELKTSGSFELSHRTSFAQNLLRWILGEKELSLGALDELDLESLVDLLQSAPNDEECAAATLFLLKYALSKGSLSWTRSFTAVNKEIRTILFAETLDLNEISKIDWSKEIGDDEKEILSKLSVYACMCNEVLRDDFRNFTEELPMHHLISLVRAMAHSIVKTITPAATLAVLMEGLSDQILSIIFIEESTCKALQCDSFYKGRTEFCGHRLDKFMDK